MADLAGVGDYGGQRQFKWLRRRAWGDYVALWHLLLADFGVRDNGDYGDLYGMRPSVGPALAGLHF